TYDLKPEMSALEVTNEFLKQLDKDKYDVIIVNFANTDMVGHTCMMDAAVCAVEVVDRCLGRVVEATLQKKGTVLITADHGNAEVMETETGEPFSAHTVNPVPFIMVSPKGNNFKLCPGKLEDVAPTILDLLGIPKPGEMTGQSLIVK
ncbi:MAG: 2,3-bisphosphoglycerate-independent phosphoglycerate mutase, partial [Clostridia bacterium]|nr:2,3-bisphosphoglycerate-independent phosphoglycerate mutase [Clostridia bacterium]